MKSIISVFISLLVFMPSAYADKDKVDQDRYFDTSRYLYTSGDTPDSALASRGAAVQYGRQGTFLSVALAAQILLLESKDFLSLSMVQQHPEILLVMMEFYRNNPKAMIASSKEELSEKLKPLEIDTKIKPYDSEKTKLNSLRQQMEVLNLYNAIISGFLKIDRKETEVLYKSFQLESLEFVEPSEEFRKTLKNPSSVNSLNVFLEKHFKSTTWRNMLPFVVGTAVLSYGSLFYAFSISGNTLNPSTTLAYIFIIYPFASLMVGGKLSVVIPALTRDFLAYFPFVSKEKKQAFEEKMDKALKKLNNDILKLNKENQKNLSCRNSA